MKNHINLYKPLVICGPKGSGKTEFSEFASTILGCRHINIGDLLLATMEKSGVYPQNRSDIGHLFIDHFGIDGYSDIVLFYTDNNIILDGIRIANIVLKFKNITGCNVIFRIGKNGITSPNFSRSSDGFENELISILEIADLIVPWFPDIRDLHGYIENLFSDNWPNTSCTSPSFHPEVK